MTTAFLRADLDLEAARQERELREALDRDRDFRRVKTLRENVLDRSYGITVP